MNKTFLFTVVFSFSTFLIQAQNNWQPGYIIKNSGDTITGLVDLRDSKSNSQTCYFKTQTEAETVSYHPTEIFGYRFTDGKYYVSKLVKEIDAENPVFLEFIVKAEASMYHYRDNQSHYFIEKDSILYALVNTESDKKHNDVVYRTKNKEYLRILTYLLRDADINSEIQNTQLNAKSLTKLAQNYHNIVCTEEACIIYERKPNKASFHWGVYAGLPMSKVNFGNQTLSDYAPGYCFGLQFEIEHFINWIENLYISTGIEFQHLGQYHFYASDEKASSTIVYEGKGYRLSSQKYFNSTTGMDANLDTWLLKVPLIFNYYLNKGKAKPYLGGGVLNMFTLSQNEEFVYNSFYNYFGQSIPNYHLGFVLNAGLKYQIGEKHHVYTGVSFEKTQTTNINQFLRFSYQAIAIKCGYMF